MYFWCNYLYLSDYKKNKHMKSFTQTSTDIEHVIECIDFIPNRNIINFNTQQQIIGILEYSLQSVENINLMNFFDEIWNETSYSYRLEQAELLLNKKFSLLLNWKKSIDDIKDLNNSIIGDCNSFVNHQRLINIIISPECLDRMIVLYQGIGHRLLKMRRDCLQLIEKIKQKVKEEIEEKERNEYPVYNKFILNPDKLSQFVAELNKLYQNDFFLPVAQDTHIRRKDVVYGFQKFLDVELPQFTLPKVIYKNKKDLSEIPAETNYEFENFLLHSNKNLLANKIRETFSTEKGKAISLLLYALESNNPPLITIGNRQLKSIYRALQALLNRDIGTYQSVNYKYVEESDKPDLESIRLKLNHILTELDKEQLA